MRGLLTHPRMTVEQIRLLWPGSGTEQSPLTVEAGLGDSLTSLQFCSDLAQTTKLEGAATVFPQRKNRFKMQF